MNNITAEANQAAKKSTKDFVLEEVIDLHAREQIVTRETLADFTGRKLAIIDEALRTLVNEERVARVQRGVYVPVVQHPEARLVSLTVLPDGTVKLEIGDDHVLTLTPREARSVGVTLGGLAAQAASIEAGHQAALMASAFNNRLSKLEGVIRSALAVPAQTGLDL